MSNLQSIDKSFNAISYIPSGYSSFLGSSISFMEPNTEGLLPDSFKTLQNKAFIGLNALFDNNVSGSTIKLPEEPYFFSSPEERIEKRLIDGLIDWKSKQAVEKYFFSSPEERKELRKMTADSIKSDVAVLRVIYWADRRDIRDSENAIIDLLAKVDYMTLEVGPIPVLDTSVLDMLISNNSISAKSIATLLDGIARAEHIPIKERIEVILKWFKSEYKIIKESVINGLSLLFDEAKESKEDRKILPICISYLEWFASDKQSDSFIREYAQNVITEDNITKIKI